MAEPTETERLRELGKLLMPFLTVYIATQLAAARLTQVGLGTPAWRQSVLDECLADAVYLLKVI